MVDIPFSKLDEWNPSIKPILCDIKLKGEAYKTLELHGFHVGCADHNGGRSEIRFNASHFNLEKQVFFNLMKKLQNSQPSTPPKHLSSNYVPTTTPIKGNRRKLRLAIHEKCPEMLQERTRSKKRNEDMEEEEEEKDQSFLTLKEREAVSIVLEIVKREMGSLTNAIKKCFGRDLFGESTFFHGEFNPKHGNYDSIIETAAPSLKSILSVAMASPKEHIRTTLNQSKVDRSLKCAVDILINSRTQGQSYLPHLDPQSLVRTLAGSSNYITDLQSHQGMGRCSGTMRKVKNKLPEVYGDHIKGWLQMHPKPGKVFVYGVIADNYNPSHFVFMDEKSTFMVATLSFLIFRIEVNETATSGEIKLNLQLEKRKLKERIDAFVQEDDVYYLKNSDMDILDSENFQLPHFRQFKVLEPQPGHSSSYEDIWELVYVQVCRDVLDCGRAFVVAVTDPEPQMAINHYISQHPDLMLDKQGLIPFFGLFHLVFHYSKGVLIDHYNFLLLQRFLVPLFSNHKCKTYKNIVRSAIGYITQSLPAGAKRRRGIAILNEDLVVAPVDPALDLVEEGGVEAAEEEEEEEEDMGAEFGIMIDDDAEDVDVGEGLPIGEVRGYVEGIIQRDRYSLQNLMRFLAYASENGTSTGVVENYRKLCLFAKRPKVDIMALRLVSRAIGRVGHGLETRLGQAFVGIKQECDLVLDVISDLFEGRSNLLFQRLPAIFAKISYDNHPKLMRAYLPFLHQLEVIRETRPELLEALAQNVLVMNDAFIEHLNSMLSSILSNKVLDVGMIQKAAVQAAMRTQIAEQLFHKPSNDGELKKEFCRDVKLEMVNKAHDIIIELLRRSSTYEDAADDGDDGNSGEKEPKRRRNGREKGHLKPDVFYLGYKQLKTSVDLLDDPSTPEMVETSGLRAALSRYILKTLREAAMELIQGTEITLSRRPQRVDYVNVIALKLYEMNLHTSIDDIEKNVFALTKVELCKIKSYIPKRPGSTKNRDILRENIMEGKRITRSGRIYEGMDESKEEEEYTEEEGNETAAKETPIKEEKRRRGRPRKNQQHSNKKQRNGY